ncbi:MAG TPA: hypothetical protein VGU61_11285 [Noviherbaspirillum sp.]|jgi:hypothetical protein|uniref:hypothetical protein n=1 Tax=Noviherbaspirillum sp. TaxID=1926288 RepID=UPI002DDCF5F6|nr:hypothetical protein [Noviherbaspirillum sp.]HEV2610841.1 hypothetical protein [Noviherbaspirillum sp.]
MQTLHCNLGKWKAEAQIQEVENGNKLMAVILVTDQDGNRLGESKHTMVFDHKQGADTLEETRAVVTELLNSRYGA